MFSDSTINDVKESAKVVEVISEFVKLQKRGTNWVCNCPFHEEKTPSFTINPNENFYKCFGGCGKSGDSIQFLIDYKKWTYQDAIKYLADKYKIPVMQNTNAPKTYTKPLWKNKTDLPDNIIKWFENERKISQQTLKKMKVTAEVVWMPEGKRKKGDNVTIIPAGERMATCFNYFRDGELINVKYRDGAKTMRMEKGAELIFYNIDSLKEAKEVYILEGEVDALTLIEAGMDLKPNTAILSVPNGANIKSNNLTYLDSSADLFENVEKIYIGSDNDPAGRKLRDDLSERFGKERCYYIEWKDKKDANEVLVAYGIQGVIECCATPKEFPLVGAFPASSFIEEVKDLYHNGLDVGVGTGIEEFDKLIKFAKGYLTVITGISSHGKSSMLDQLCVLLTLKHGWKFAFYSPENRPTKLHISNIIRKMVGKNWFGQNRLTEKEMSMAIDYLEGKFYWIKPEKDFTLKSVLDHAKQLKTRYGIDAVIFDSWNKFEHKLGKSAETQYISEQLDLLLNFLEANNIHGFLVAHPTKMEKDKKDSRNYVIPNLYSIAGSAAFFSKADNGLCVYRDYVTGKTKVFVQKIRFSHWGELGYTEWDYHKETGRFNICSGGISIPDLSNWITKENRQAKIDLADAHPIAVYDGDIPF